MSRTEVTATHQPLYISVRTTSVHWLSNNTVSFNIELGIYEKFAKM